MIPWRELGRATVVGESAPLVLWQRGDEFVIRTGATALMSSGAHGSEQALAERACARFARAPAVRGLVGGLGMGYTLAAALRSLGSGARVDVAELVPEVVDWNRGPLASLAGDPLSDPRVSVLVADVGVVIRAARAAYDFILLDVDNGPAGLTRAGNDALYSRAGLAAAARALTPGGVLAVWSVAPDPAFARRMSEAGFDVEERLVRARGSRGGRHTLWLGEKRDSTRR